MSTDFQLNAKVRDVAGKGASRRLRRLANEVPGIVYGDGKAPLNISINQHELLRNLENEAFYSHVISLNVDGKTESVILKDLQRHPSKAQLLHADFLRVSKTKKIVVSVPLHFINEDTCKGVKLGGGSIAHNLTQLEISCLASDLPEYIEVDLADVDVGQILHISDLKLPKGVESVALSHGADHDLPVVSVNKAKGGEEEAPSA
ncbi:50S ribosomal protein L25/general stress protein Ctc [Saccharophagus sp. K07]|uniref:50S ribosomal protein L25/general stress protein Ctc n=1 Tax=Saccharophagus sp. K07 TaxID=2283636 RepID=UPI0016529348|nr:50S ribosomal protein L25/general stress protein Ctc [Saccharophagus sp. K07]MBC6907258.1 50S ribosomal protein L25/general stress protein Ctc [Saccharophagus sp. K07]